MKKILVLTLITFVSAEPQYPADSLLTSENSTFLQKLFIYPIAQWQRISYNSNAFNCQFYPSCSNYCSIAIKEKGAVIGSIIGVDRITRCNPSALYYHQKINGAYKDSDGRIIDNINPRSYQKNNKSELLAVSLSLIPGMGRIYAGRAPITSQSLPPNTRPATPQNIKTVSTLVANSNENPSSVSSGTR